MAAIAKQILKLLVFISLVYSILSYAVDFSLPPTIAPSRVQQSLLQTEPSLLPKPKAVLAPPEPPQGKKLSEQAKKLVFTLKKIILVGNHVISDEELSTIYKDSLNKKISLADLFSIVEKISDYYRNHGYILSRAILPPQTIANGMVKIQIIEGYIAKANVVGTPYGSKRLVQAFGNHIVDNRPTQLNVMERYMRLANEIPGTSVKAVLQPSKTDTGASDIDLYTAHDNYSAGVSYDNFGTRYIGPQEATVSAAINSIFRSGDQTAASGSMSSNGKDLRSGSFTHDTPLGTYGARLAVGGYVTETNPRFVLTNLELVGRAKSAFATVTLPLLRTLTDRLNIFGSLNYINSGTNSIVGFLYLDKIRWFQAGTLYEFTDKHRGSNQAQLIVSQGLDILDPTPSGKTSVSRFGGTAEFTKINFQAIRLQGVTDHFSVYFLASGQYSFQPLLVPSQYGFGGSVLGRGYDPSEIIGDRGLAGSIEARLDTAPSLRILQAVEYYAFYDIGKIWNILTLNQPSNLSASSTGVGARFQFTQHVNGNFFVAQPLTKQVAAEELIGNGRCPRVFFSVSVGT